MASIKVKFRPSTIEGKEGTVYYQIIQNRVIRQLKTDYRIFTDEWNEAGSCIIVGSSERSNLLLSLQERMEWDLKRLDMIIRQLDNRKTGYTADDIIASFQSNTEGQSFFNFMQGIIARLKQMGKIRTAENYSCTLKSFMQFRGDRDVLLSEIDSDLMQLYEAYLHGKGAVRNTSSFYMRILRAAYNRAQEKGLMEQRNPFRHVYTGVDKTVKRAVPLSAIKRMKNLDLSLQPNLEFARDMFLFSFLYPWHVVHRYGSPEKERSSERIFIVSQTKDRAAAGYQVGKMHARDCRQIPGRQSQSLSFAGIEISF